MRPLIGNTMQWRIQEFQNWGPGAVEFLGSGNCFYALSYIPYLFIARVEIECWLQSKYIRILQKTFTKKSVGGGCLSQAWIKRLCFESFINNI